MEILYSRYKNRDFALLAVDLGESKTDVQKFIERSSLSFPVALDGNQKVGSLYSIEAIPTSYLINKDGRIVGRVQGSIRWDTPSVYALFDYLLSE
jgi:peroxiredoxin